MQMCSSCVRQLTISFQFRQTVIAAQENIRNGILKVDTVPTIHITLTHTGLESDIKPTATSTQNLVIKAHEYVFPNPDPIIDIHDDTNFSNDDDEEDFDQKLTRNNDRIDTPKSMDESKAEGEMMGIEKYECPNCEAVLRSSTASQHTCLARKVLEEGRETSTVQRNGRMLIQEGKSEKSEHIYDCEYCSFTFDKRWKVQKHILKAHGKERKFACTFCNKTFKQSYHLREHLTSHTGERNFTCQSCGKSFLRISSMQRHMRSHSATPGQKTKRTPFLCTVCGKSFPFSNGVQRHMRTHLGIRNHECQVCHRRFTQSTHLRVHMRTHTGEKPYVCETCGDSFALNASLQKHLAYHAREDMKFMLIEPTSLY